MAGHDVWHTPPALFSALNDEFRFELDVACNASNCLTRLGMTVEKFDALVTEWNDPRIAIAPPASVWCNPPYSQMAAFVERAWEQSQRHRLTVVLLIPAYTDPAYWWDVIVPNADEIRFLKGRVSFLEHGAKKESARFPSVVVVFRWRQGISRGFPRVWWWDWKTETRAEVLAPLFSEASA